MKRNYKFILMTFIVAIAIFIGCSSVEAASFSMTGSTSSVDPGGTFTITLKSDGAGKVNLSCSNGSLSESSVWLDNNSATVTCTAAGSGEKVTVTASAVIADYGTGKDENKSGSVSATIIQPATPTPTPTPVPETPTPTPEPTEVPGTTPEPTAAPEVTPEPTAVPEVTPGKSSNANLSNLGIRPNDFTGFKQDTTSYNVSVPYNVEKVEVYASKADGNQTVEGTGTKTLQEGSNVFSVLVTAEDGSQKEYRITIVRLAKENNEEPNINNNEEEKVEIALTSIQIADVTLNEPFKSNVYEYTATVGKDAKKVVANGSANVQDAIIDVDAPEEFKEGENIIKITVKSKDGKDKKEYVIKAIKGEEEKKEEEKKTAVVGKTENNNKNNGSGIPIQTIIYCIGVAIVAALGILFAVIRYRKDNYVEDDEDEFDFVGDISTKEAIKDAAVATRKLAGTNAEVAAEDAGETRRKGKHF